jgi:hypothetical protein
MILLKEVWHPIIPNECYSREIQLQWFVHVLFILSLELRQLQLWDAGGRLPWPKVGPGQGLAATGEALPARSPQCWITYHTHGTEARAESRTSTV